jgi:hypothetical protein
MADPFRLRILKKLTGVLERATFSYDGYETGAVTVPLTGRVFRGRVIFGENDPLPMLTILETPVPEDQLEVPVNSDYAGGAWDLIIQGFVDDDPVNPTDPAHYLLAEVKRELVLEKRKVNDGGIFDIPKRITNLRFGPGVVRPPDEISAKAYFWLSLALDVVEDITQPYQD